MVDVATARQCGRCYFARLRAGSLCCVRNPPVPDPATGRARWPIVEPTDTCGRFRRTAPAQNRKSSIINRKSPALPVHADALGPYCRIPLTQGKFAKVDPEDYIRLSQFRWCCKVGPDACYACRHVQVRGRTKRIYMHRQIMDTPDGCVCDHINHDGLDNRRKNCRNCTCAQNNANRRKRATSHGSRATSSQYIGVSYCRKRRKWVSYIKHCGRSRFLGQFESEAEAARAHDKAAWAQWGEYASLNFPHEWPGHPAAKPPSGGP